MVLREFTTGVRRTDCLESMGLAQVIYGGINSKSKGIQELATTLGISPDEAAEGVILILDNWRRNRILYVNGDPIYSHFHFKDDPYIQAGLLPLREFRPEGLLFEPDQANKYARSLIARRGASAVQALLKKWASDPQNQDIDAAAAILWDLLTKEAKILTKVTLRSPKEKPLAGDVWQVNSERLVVEQSQSRQRCTTCQRVTSRDAPNSACIATTATARQ